MYYKEKFENGKWYIKSTPNGKWHEMVGSMLREKLTSLYSDLKEKDKQIEKLEEIINEHPTELQRYYENGIEDADDKLKERVKELEKNNNTISLNNCQYRSNGFCTA